MAGDVISNVSKIWSLGLTLLGIIMEVENCHFDSRECKGFVVYIAWILQNVPSE